MTNKNYNKTPSQERLKEKQLLVEKLIKEFREKEKFYQALENERIRIFLDSAELIKNMI